MNYGNQVETAMPIGGGLRRASVRDRLDEQLKYHHEQVAKIEEAIALLNKHPELERLQDLLASI